jgi:hypothetical protein
MTKYRVWFVINPPNEPNYCSVESPEKGADFIKEQIKNQSKIPSIFSNAFGLETDEGFGWSEWYNEVGEDINEAFGLE